jgi:anti-repressor protein
LTDLQIFKNEQFGEVRVIEKDGQAYFCLADINKALEINNSSQVKARLKHDGVISNEVIDSMGRTQMANFINEGNLYRLIMQSRKEAAERFTDWVTDEVLPSIRKHGMYATQELLDNPDLLIQVATALKEERERNKQLSHEVQVKTQLIGELKPKADYVDRILKNPGLMTITQIAKDYGMSGQAMNELLHTKGVQYKQSGQWLLYSEFHSMGYTHSQTVEIERTGGIPDTKLNTKWTQKGRLFIYDLLKEDGVLPIIEKAA